MHIPTQHIIAWQSLTGGTRTLRVEYSVAAGRLPGHELGNQLLQLPCLGLDHGYIACNILLAAESGGNSFQLSQVTCTSCSSPCSSDLAEGLAQGKPCVHISSRPSPH